MLELGCLKLYVGLHFLYLQKRLLLVQHMYIADLLKKFGMQHSNYCLHPMEEFTLHNGFGTY